MTHETCYACDAPATGREHVPPQSLFLKAKDSEGRDYRRNLITVPSCDEHNGAKSKDDEYFVNVVALNVTANQVGMLHVDSRIRRAIERSPAVAETLFARSREEILVDSSTGKEHEAREVELDGARFFRVLELVAKGIYRHHFGRRWVGEQCFAVADFIANIEPGSPMDSAWRQQFFEYAEGLFRAATRLGEDPDVFLYQVHEERGGEFCVIRMRFLGHSTATAIFGLPAP